jgi:hypothetical protein
VPADLVDRHDVRVVELRRVLRLDLEPAECLRRRQPAGQDHLERDDAPNAHLPGAHDQAHAAARDLAEHLVLAETGQTRAARSRWREWLGHAMENFTVGEELP